MPPLVRIIIIDTGKSIPADCRHALAATGFTITLFESVELGLGKISQESFDVALLSREGLGRPCIEVLKRLKQESPNTAVVILAGNKDEDAAAAEAEHGAFESLSQPITPESLTKIVVTAASHTRRVLEDSCIGQELERMMLSQVLIGRSEPMTRVGRFVRKAAMVDSAVLITGEPGTGKKVVARVIHRLSRRSNGRFVTVDCRKFTEMRLESELFGYTRGSIPDTIGSPAGNIEIADSGTLFLDEIADIGGSIQEKLLQVILEQKIPSAGNSPDKKVNIRIISATTRDMVREMDEGKFREDLFYRLNSLHIPIPPLRERLEDIPLLADYYIRKFSAEKQHPAPALSEEAMRSLKRREWPGNVSELIRVLEHAVTTCRDKTIEFRNLPPEEALTSESEQESVGHLARLEKSEILRILDQFHGNKTRAAKYLGINRKTLREKMERYGLRNSN